MGLSTQSSFPGQPYSMGCINSTSSFGSGSSRLACPLPSVDDAPLASQKSIYSLILDEFQNAPTDPGKSLGSMNMEELVKNIWTTEEGQAMAAAMGIGDVTELSKQKSLQKQVSLSCRGALSQKTVGEVWNGVYERNAFPADSSQLSTKQREFTVREVTLEDFLVKAGIVPEEDFERNVIAEGSLSSCGGQKMQRDEKAEIEGTVGSRPDRNMYSSPTSVLPGDTMDSKPASQIGSPGLFFSSADYSVNQLQDGGILQQSQFLKQSPSSEIRGTCGLSNGKKASDAGLTISPIGLGGLGQPLGGGIAASLNASPSFVGFSNPLSLVGPAHKTESPLSSDGTGTSQGCMPLSPVYHSGMNVSLRKRFADEQLETVVERRQRRMIKNRESAARSRARKQAYTVELENELTELRAVNEKLKLKQEIADRRLKKVLAFTLEAPKQPGVLLRSRTGPW